MDIHLLRLIGIAEMLLLTVSVYIAVFFFLRSFPSGIRRFAFRRTGGLSVEPSPGRLWLRLLVVKTNPDALAELRQLLAGAGIRVHALSYALWRRWAQLIFACGLAAAMVARHAGGEGMGGGHSFPFLFAAAGLAAASGDRIWLDALRKLRSQRIVAEIYVLSTQLLYYSGSQMNLHGKLARCLPHTRLLRSDLRMLVNDWYGDAEAALRNFRDRIGTEDGYGFAETLNALRQHEDEAYYELLRQRVQDYKDKLDLIRAGKKETASYVLFVLAGLPILNTFRLFIYPWVIEGQKLFDSLNG